MKSVDSWQKTFVFHSFLLISTRSDNCNCLWILKILNVNSPFSILHSQLQLYLSLERRWSSRTFRYGYLVTTSPQSSAPPSAASSLLLDYRLRVLQTLMVWRAVCTRPGNVFTVVCWPTITSNSDFMWASCSPQSELGLLLGICSTLRYCVPL